MNRDSGQWRTSIEPDELLILLHDHGKPSQRNLRLFSCACVRRVWNRLATVRSGRKAVELAEEFADGRASAKALLSASARSENARFVPRIPKERNAAWSAALCASPVMDALGITRTAAWASAYASRSPSRIERPFQAELLRDVFANPFDAPDASPMSLRTDRAILDLARMAYESRKMPSGRLFLSTLRRLADALERAGCTDVRILSHCRESRIHVRGCWVIDLILGNHEP